MLSAINTDKKFCVYVHTNKINGKKYVGVTSQHPEKRWNNGKGYTKRQPHMYNAIQKYGWDNFDHEILIDGVLLEHASSLERMLIKAWQLQDRRYGYNDQSGGLEYSSLSMEIREKISKAHKGREKSEEHRQHLSDSKKGKPLSKETKEKISLVLKGRAKTEEQKEKLSRALKGRVFSDEHKANISKGKKEKPQSDAQKQALARVCEQNKGRKHTSEVKAKISASNKGKVKKNSVAIAQYDIITKELINTYSSIMDAHNKTGILYNSIWNCVKEKSKSGGGFYWEEICS